jgi:predicted transposase YbfD/YdcC
VKYITLNVTLPTEPLLFQPDSLYARFLNLTGRRKARGKRYPLAVLLIIALLARLVEQNSPRAMADWAKLRQAELSQIFELPRQAMPHYSTWSRVLDEAVDQSELEQLVGSFFQAARSSELPQRGSILLNIDGKTLRGTIALGHTSGLHLLAAYLPDEGLVLMEVAVDKKAHEIVAAPRLLAELDLHGMVVTGDAMHCQRQLSAQIVTAGGDYVWFVKDNQPSLLEDITILFEPEPVAPSCSAYPTDFESFTLEETGHGRHEKRTITISSMLKDYTPWPYLEQVFKLERWYSDKLERTSYEVRYGITSLPRALADAPRLLALARGEWGIENKLHWRRDVLFNEDHCQLRRGNAPHSWAILNNTALGLLALPGVSDIAYARRQLAYQPDQALALLLA